MDQPGESSASSTRSFDTSRGSLTYAELTDATAPLLEALLEGVLRGDFVGKPFDEELVNDLHRALLAPMLPKMAGRWRATSVQVGNHAPPQPWEIPLRMRNYVDNVNARILGADTFELMGRLDIRLLRLRLSGAAMNLALTLKRSPNTTTVGCDPWSNSGMHDCSVGWTTSVSRRPPFDRAAQLVSTDPSTSFAYSKGWNTQRTSWCGFLLISRHPRAARASEPLHTHRKLLEWEVGK